MRFFIPATRRYRIADTWRLYPSHCATPTISPEDVTVLAVCDVLRLLDGTVPATLHDAVALQTAIRNLHAIVSPAVPDNAAAPRVGVAPSPRVPRAARDARALRPTVSNDAAPPVLYPRVATTSLDTTSRARIHGMRFVHQWTTCNNNPFAPLETDDNDTPDAPTDDDDPDCTANDAKIHADNRTPPARPQQTRCSSTPQPRPPPTTRTLWSAVTPRVFRSGGALLLPTRRIETPPPIPTLTMRPQLPPPAPPVVPPPRHTPSNIPKLPIQHPPIFPPVKPLTIPLRSSPPAFIEPDDNCNNDYRDDSSSKRPPSPPLRKQTPRGHASISRQALYHVINLAFNAPPMYTILRALLESLDRFSTSLTLKKYATALCTLSPRRPLQNNPN